MTAIAVSWWDGSTDVHDDANVAPDRVEGILVGFVHSPTPDSTVLGKTYGIVLSDGCFIKVPLSKLSFEDWR